MEISLKQGEFLVRLARRAVEKFVLDNMVIHPPLDFPESLQEKAGVFVTLNKLNGKEKELRGCIGIPLPEKPLIEAVIDSAVSSATQDPRFTPVTKEELENVGVEVSVLTPPEEIKVDSPLQYPSRIMVGKDGLIMKWAFGSGLLLPQVPVEYGWDSEEFLTNACMKAGAPPDCWLSKDVKILKFSALVFAEVKPQGDVVENFLGATPSR